MRSDCRRQRAERNSIHARRSTDPDSSGLDAKRKLLRSALPDGPKGAQVLAMRTDRQYKGMRSGPLHERARQLQNSVRRQDTPQLKLTNRYSVNMKRSSETK